MWTPRADVPGADAADSALCPVGADRRGGQRESRVLGSQCELGLARSKFLGSVGIRLQGLEQRLFGGFGSQAFCSVDWACEISQSQAVNP